MKLIFVFFILYRIIFVFKTLKISNILYFSLRYLKSPKNHKKFSLGTVLSFLGVMISVATLIVVMSVMNGFVLELTSKILGTNSHVTLSNFSSKPIEKHEDILQKIKSQSEVLSANAVIDGQGMIINSKTQSSNGALIKAYIFEDLQKKDIIFESLDLYSECKNDIFRNNSGIILGKYLASNIGAKKGDEVSLVTSVGDNTIFGFMPRYKNFIVCGTFETGSSLSDASMALVSFQAGQILFKYKNSISGIEIYLKDYMKAQDFVEKVTEEKIWNKYITTWQTQNDGLFHAMKIERSVMAFILTLFLLVSMFGIFANMNSMIQSKFKNIAIMMSMGISKNDIWKIFFFSGGIIGILGTIFGGLLGILFANNITTIKSFLENITGVGLFDGAVYFLSYLPSEVQYSEVFLTMTMAMVFTIISSIIPAKKASKVKISDTLRQV